MDDNTHQLAMVHKKIQQRFLFSAITLILYGSFVLCYTKTGGFLSQPIGDSSISGALLLFFVLIVILLMQEYLFLFLHKEKNNGATCAGKD